MGDWIAPESAACYDPIDMAGAAAWGSELTVDICPLFLTDWTVEALDGHLMFRATHKTVRVATPAGVTSTSDLVAYVMSLDGQLAFRTVVSRAREAIGLSEMEARTLVSDLVRHGIVIDARAVEWASVDRYLTDLLLPFDSVLYQTLETSAKAGLAPISVSPLMGRLLWMVAKLSRATSVLEIGTLGGYSTIWLGRAVAPVGRVITLESNPVCVRVARANIERADLRKTVQVRSGNALDSLQEMWSSGQEPFDLIFIDADKASYPDYLNWAVKLSHPGSIVVADNVVRGGAIARGSEHPSVQGARTFLENLNRESRVTATVIQTVGMSGYDGLAIALIGQQA
jgi:predicted O-methyltransferase YrrM